MTSMPMHTSTITGVVQDIFRSLDDVVQAADRPPIRRHIQRRPLTDKWIRMMTLYLIGWKSAAVRGSSASWAAEQSGHRIGRWKHLSWNRGKRLKSRLSALSGMGFVQ